MFTAYIEITIALSILYAFFAETLQGKKHPVCSWVLSEADGCILLSADAEYGILQKALLWTAESDDRDFRDAVWISKVMEEKGAPKVQVNIDYPEQGYKAFYVDLIYDDPNGDQYAKSTRIFVADAKSVL